MEKQNKDMPSESPELRAKLKQVDIEVQEYVVALKSEIFKLQKKNVKLEAESISLRFRITALKEENLQYIKHKPLELMSLDELEENIKRLDKAIKKSENKK